MTAPIAHAFAALLANAPSSEEVTIQYGDEDSRKIRINDFRREKIVDDVGPNAYATDHFMVVSSEVWQTINPKSILTSGDGARWEMYNACDDGGGNVRVLLRKAP
jgi:hypothetical protein